MTQNVVMYTVEVNTENPENILLPYLTANVRFLAQKESNVLVVPNQALRWSPSSLAQVSPDFRSPRPADPPASSTTAKDAAGALTTTAQGAKPAVPGPPRKVSPPANLRLGVVWITDGPFARPVEVAVGTSDGTKTALNSGAVQEGDEVVVGDVTDAAQAGPRNPFLPQAIKR